MLQESDPLLAGTTKGKPSMSESRTVLVVDDSEENLLLLKRILTSGGFTVEVCSKSNLVLACAVESKPAVILLDITMPGIDGYKACQMLKQEPLTTSIPVIFISALESIPSRLRGFEVGGVDYIVKPFEIEETLARVRTQVSIFNLQRKLEHANQELDKRLLELTFSKKQVQDREQKLRAVVKALPNSMFVYDETGHYLEIFTSEPKNILLPREEMLGKSVFDILPLDIARLKIETIETILRTGQNKVIEYPLTMPDGKPEWYEGRMALMERTEPLKGKVICVTNKITERVNLYKKVESLAIHDPLTDCFNRRHFLELAEAEIARSNRFDHPLSLMIMDIDHFKKINDKHGHPVGDEVLRKLIDLCKGMLRPTDVIGRYGGEEFCVLFSETGMLGSYQAAERLRRKIAETSFAVQDGSLSITVSIGLACLEMMGDRSVSVNDLLEEADKALYAAKEDGRNRIHTNCQGFPVGMQLEGPQTDSLRASKLNFDDII